ncbi:MAG: XdhC family protein [Paracoccaceae bacterium]
MAIWPPPQRRSRARPFVSVVTSGRKVAVPRRRPEARGIDPARITALRAPAGIAIGAIIPVGIALSVVAEIVARLA